MDTTRDGGGFRSDLWGSEDSMGSSRFASDATEDLRGGRVRSATDATSKDSFNEQYLEATRRMFKAEAAPLPHGVEDINWRPPQATGLRNSTPIMEQKVETRGGSRITTRILTSSNNHFRSWQEDNGVARAFASETVKKQVDGTRRVVSIASTQPVSVVRTQPLSVVRTQPDSIPALSSPALKQNAELVASPFESTRQSLQTQEKSTVEAKASTATNAFSQQPSPTPHHPPMEPVGGSGAEQDCTHHAEGGGSRVAEGSGPAGPPTDAPDPAVPPKPSRPLGALSSSHSQQSRPGRSHSRKEVVGESLEASALPKRESGTAEARQAGLVASSRWELGEGVIGDEGDEQPDEPRKNKRVSSNFDIDPAPGGLVITGEATGIGHGQGGQQSLEFGAKDDPVLESEIPRIEDAQGDQRRQQRCTESRSEGIADPSGLTPSLQVKQEVQTSCWAFFGNGKLLSRRSAQQPRQDIPEMTGGERELPAIT